MNSKKNAFELAGLYVHIPFCEAKCRYCGFYSKPVKNYDPARLVSALIAELGRYGRSTTFNTAYIGGGSPSCLPREQLLRLIGEIASWHGLPARENTAKPIQSEVEGKAVPLLNPDEFTIEVNPGQVDKPLLSQLREIGINRLSIGAQSFNDDELAFLGRGHSADDINRAVESAKQAGFDNISVDLIFAIPGSTLGSWQHSLREAIELNVRHISAYSLSYEEGTPLKKMVEAGEIEKIDEETDRTMYEVAIDELERAGFKQYEISNFARPGFECEHNLNYWANRPYIGIGPSAASFWRGKHTGNIADIKKYIDAIEQFADATAECETPNPTQLACETAVLNLRRRRGIDLKEFKNRTGFEATQLFAEPIDRYKNLGLIEATNGRLFLTRNALAIADSVLCDFSDV